MTYVHECLVGSCIYIKRFFLLMRIIGSDQSAYTLIEVRAVIGWCVDFFERLLKHFISNVLDRAVVWCCCSRGDLTGSALSAGYPFLTRVFTGLLPLSISLCLSLRHSPIS